MPIGIDADGRERLVFIEGEVAVPPYPWWAQADDALASIAVLMRQFHEASRSIDTAGSTWSTEMADPDGGELVCHNDVCLENVVFRDGVAVGLIDFDFAAPGRPVYDVAQMARMCVPVDDEVSAARLGWAAGGPLGAAAVGRRRVRPRAVPERRELVDALAGTIARGGEFVRRQVEAGDPNFIKMWDDMGGMERFDRRRRWWAAHEDEFSAALA